MAIGTFAIIIPGIWLMDYKSQRTYEMRPLPETTTGDEAPEPVGAGPPGFGDAQTLTQNPAEWAGTSPPDRAPGTDSPESRTTWRSE